MSNDILETIDDSETSHDGTTRELFARIADIEVHVIGTEEDDLENIETIFERQLSNVLDEYSKHRDDGAMY